MRRFNSGPGLRSYKNKFARVAELVYAHDLKSCLARDVGSIPTSGTITKVIKVIIHAGMAKLADALALGASGSNPMGVQVSLPAQFNNLFKGLTFIFEYAILKI